LLLGPISRFCSEQEKTEDDENETLQPNERDQDSKEGEPGKGGKGYSRAKAESPRPSSKIEGSGWKKKRGEPPIERRFGDVQPRTPTQGGKCAGVGFGGIKENKV